MRCTCPAGGRAPGWDAGIVVARRQLSGRAASAGAGGRPPRRRARARKPAFSNARHERRFGSSTVATTARTPGVGEDDVARELVEHARAEPRPTRSGSPIIRSTPAAPAPTWTSSSHSGWSSTRYVWIIPTGRPSTRIANCRVGRGPRSRPSASRSPPRSARATTARRAPRRATARRGARRPARAGETRLAMFLPDQREEPRLGRGPFAAGGRAHRLAQPAFGEALPVVGRCPRRRR